MHTMRPIMSAALVLLMMVVLPGAESVAAARSVEEVDGARQSAIKPSKGAITANITALSKDGQNVRSAIFSSHLPASLLSNGLSFGDIICRCISASLASSSGGL
jgi:hypothetical protein